MSLKLAKAFVSALRSDNTLLQALGAKEDAEHHWSGARIFSIARTESEEKDDKIPYVIVMPRGVTSEGDKDDYERYDSATISMLCVTKEYGELVELTEKIREVIEDNLDDLDDVEVADYSFSADEVMYDPEKPCYFQTLTYVCSTQKK